jgi:hypothetical protein
VIRQAAGRVAARADVPDDWLNDAVKGFLSPRGHFDSYLDLDHLLRYLNITSVEEALEIVTRYFDAERLPPKRA